MRVDADGLAIPEDAWRKPPRLIQATPTHQYPTGAVLSVARRLDLLERARRVLDHRGRLPRTAGALRDALAAHMDVEHDVLAASGLPTVRLPPCFPDTRIAEQSARA